MVFYYINGIKEGLIVSLITALFIIIISWIYNKIPVYIRPHKVIQFLYRYEGIEIKLSQIYYLNSKEITLDWKEIENKLSKIKNGFTHFNSKRNYIDLTFKNSNIMFRLGEREHDENVNCFFIKMLTPIKKRIFIGSTIRDIQGYFKKLNSYLPFNKDRENSIIGEVCLISDDKTKIELKYKKEIDNCELSITKDKIQVGCSESEDIEKILKKGIFKQMDLMLK